MPEFSIFILPNVRLIESNYSIHTFSLSLTLVKYREGVLSQYLCINWIRCQTVRLLWMKQTHRQREKTLFVCWIDKPLYHQVVSSNVYSTLILVEVQWRERDPFEWVKKKPVIHTTKTEKPSPTKHYQNKITYVWTMNIMHTREHELAIIITKMPFYLYFTIFNINMHSIWSF